MESERNIFSNNYRISPCRYPKPFNIDWCLISLSWVVCFKNYLTIIVMQFHNQWTIQSMSIRKCKQSDIKLYKIINYALWRDSMTLSRPEMPSVGTSNELLSETVWEWNYHHKQTSVVYYGVWPSHKGNVREVFIFYKIRSFDIYPCTNRTFVRSSAFFLYNLFLFGLFFY